MKHLIDYTPEYKQTLINIIEKHLPQVKIFLFGSRARSTHRDGADIDIVLDNNEPIDTAILGEIEIDIEESDIPVFVDILDFHRISPEFKKSIEKDMISWKI